MSDGGEMPIRRVVTVNGSDGVATIESDEERRPSSPAGMSTHGVGTTVLWATEESPPKPEQGCHDGSPAWQPGRLAPETARWTEVIIHPDAQLIGMHRTETVDFAQITSGEIWLLMEDGTERHLVPGDCVVQRATKHNWENRGTEPCRMTVVMMSIETKPA